MTIEQLVAQINVVARAEFHKKYQEFNPKFGEIIYSYPSGPVATNQFVYAEFLAGIEEFKGSRKHNLFPDAYKFSIDNKEWDHAVDIKRADLERAALGGGLNSLNIYTQRIGEMPAMWKDFPVMRAFDMIEAGTANTYGLCFDGQTFYATTHGYGPSAGSQSNIITDGAGVLVANIITDLGKAKNRMNSFYYFQGGTANANKRKLNPTMNNLLVIAPDDMFSVFDEVRTKTILASGEENTHKGTFQLITFPRTDANDWDLINLDDPFFRPILNQIEKEVELDTPTVNDESAKERKVFTWGGYARGNQAYGAWWKAIRVQNS